MTLKDGVNILASLPDTELIPTLFVGHGSPLNAIEDNVFSQAWRKLGATLPLPQAILAISAHWLTEGGTLVHVNEQPKTIHDFWGFPEELYNITYPAPGSLKFAEATIQTATTPIQTDTEWGLDHGTWSVLRHMYPNANIPVFQLSIDFSQHGDFHFSLGKELQKLRSKGVLILGSGNIVHNLSRIQFAKDAPPYDWALEFDSTAKSLLDKRDFGSLTRYQSLGNAAEHAIPTPDHYWPLLYVLGATQSSDTLTYPVEGIAHGSVSMRSVLFS
jgi:4,5-DOPA dioxygenase extradiol